MLQINNPNITQPIFGRYDLIEEVGRGRHGVVYKARDINSNRIVAVKIISLPNEEMNQYALNEYGNDVDMIANFVGEVAEKFGNEVASMMQVNDSPSVIRLYDNQLIQNGIQHDIIMVLEFAFPMKKYYRQHPLTIRGFINFASHIAQGLIRCEQANIIHRDIKEDNLFLSINNNHAKLGDFGVASISETGLGSTVGMGTPYYMAPEVSKGSRYDNTADIYSLGIVLYKMLNGNKFPLAENTTASAKNALDQRMNGASLPAPAFANRELAQIVLKCCEYYPSNRYGSAAELYNDLANLARTLNPEELDRELPYLYNGTPPIPVPPPQPPIPKDEPVIDPAPTPSSDTNADKDPGFFEKTMDILQSIFQNDGRNSTVAVVFNGLLQLVTNRKADAIKQEYKKRQKRNIIILVSMCIVILLVGLVMLYPKTATFYVDTADSNSIHVQYLFLPDRRVDDDISASYLQVDGNWLYYSAIDEDHSLYRRSIWGGEPELLCDADCEYDVVIGDYIYFTSYDEGEILCRMKKDGSSPKSTVLDYACRDLKRNGNNLMFVLVDTGELKELDTTTIE